MQDRFMIKLSPDEIEIKKCRECVIFASTMTRLPEHAKVDENGNVRIYTARNGMSLDFGIGGGPVPLWTDYILCPPHRAKYDPED